MDNNLTAEDLREAYFKALILTPKDVFAGMLTLQEKQKGISNVQSFPIPDPR
jgi:hypothetical protein